MLRAVKVMVSRIPDRWRCAWRLALLIGALAWLGGDAAAAPDAAQVSTLMRRALADLPGREALMLRVAYPPGGASLPHRHDADVFVYVLQGAVIMQVAGQAARTLSAGDTFYEGPNDVHLRSANASDAAPAQLLVVMVKAQGAPVSRPASSAAAAAP